MGLFGLGKKDKFDKQRKEIEEARKRAQSLMGDLVTSVGMAKEKNRISVEELKKYRQLIVALDMQLKNAPVLRLDTSEIDLKIAVLADKMKSAIERDLPDTAKYAMEALSWGIIIGREDVNKSEVKQMADIITDRLNRLDTYITEVLAAENVDNARINKQRIEMEKLSRERQLNECETFFKEHNEVYQLLKSRMKDGLDLDPKNSEEREVANMMLEQNRLIEIIGTLEESISARQVEIINANAEISTAQITLIQSSMKRNENLPARTEQMAAELRRSLAAGDEYITKLIGGIDLTLAVLTEHEEPAAVRQQRIKAWNAHLKAEQKKLAAEAESARLKQKLEEERKAEIEKQRATLVL